jgi:hypothetical protein
MNGLFLDSTCRISPFDDSGFLLAQVSPEEEAINKNASFHNVLLENLIWTNVAANPAKPLSYLVSDSHSDPPNPNFLYISEPSHKSSSPFLQPANISDSFEVL